MPYANSEVGDFEKLRLAFYQIAENFGSVDKLLAAVGLADLPVAQRYGILFGFCVFFCTVSAVVALLVLGGTFQRIVEQSKTGRPTVLAAHEERANRALLLENLLEGRQRMQRKYSPFNRTQAGPTELTKMLLNVAPSDVTNDGENIPTDVSVDENNHLRANQQETSVKEKENTAVTRYIPPHYQANYVAAYRKCQDRPGGSALSGRPEARFEAYARGFAGCGPYTSLAYRRSYGRLYEAFCCSSHAADDKYSALFRTRPFDIVGKFVRLEALEEDRHLTDLWQVTSGRGSNKDNTKSFDPNQIWGFLPDGPFEKEDDMARSFVFRRRPNEASFAIVDNLTDRLLGAILLLRDEPENLSIQMEPPIMPPAAAFDSNKNEGTKQQLEACFLLLDRLFAHGYRRIQVSADAEDIVSQKLAGRLGFTFEGVLYKHSIIKDASRDSNTYGLLNSDWKKGARAMLFQKLYGKKALQADTSNEKREEELDERERVVQENKKEEQATDQVAKKNA